MRHFSRLGEKDFDILSAYKDLIRALEAGLNCGTIAFPNSSETQENDLFQSTEIPSNRQSLGTYLKYLRECVLPLSINVSSPYCLGHMSGITPDFTGMLSEFIVRLNQNLAKDQASGALTLLERQTIAMLHRLVFAHSSSFYAHFMQEREDILGIMTSGGTLANLIGLWCARNRAFPKNNDFAGIEHEGLAAALEYYGYERSVILGSKLMHYSISKAGRLLGLGACQVQSLPIDNKRQLCLTSLRAAIKTCRSQGTKVMAIVGLAGATECGSIDNLAGIAEIAEDEDIYFHVDASWGAPMLFSSGYRSKLVGIERADSVTIDGHKQMFAPIGISTLLVRDPMTAQALQQEARYIFWGDAFNLGRFSIEGSRPGTSLYLHAALNVIGRQGYEQIVDTNILRARQMAQLIVASDEFELLVEPETNIILYRYLPPNYRSTFKSRTLTLQENQEISQFNVALQQRQFQEGRTYVAQTAIGSVKLYPNTNIVALRALISNPKTQYCHIQEVLKDQIRVANKLRHSNWSSTVLSGVSSCEEHD